MSSLQIVLLRDDELEGIKDGQIWTDTDGVHNVLIAHESREQEVFKTVQELQQ